MSRPTIHVYPDPDGPGWLVLEMDDQEAFAWDCAHYGEMVALANWQEIHEWREAGRPQGLAPSEELQE